VSGCFLFSLFLIFLSSCLVLSCGVLIFRFYCLVIVVIVVSCLRLSNMGSVGGYARDFRNTGVRKDGGASSATRTRNTNSCTIFLQDDIPEQRASADVASAYLGGEGVGIHFSDITGFFFLFQSLSCLSCLVLFCFVLCLARVRVLSRRVLFCLVSCFVLCLVVPYRVLFCRVFRCRVLSSCLVLPYFVLSNRVVSCLVLSRLVLSRLVLSWVLSCLLSSLVLSCDVCLVLCLVVLCCVVLCCVLLCCVVCLVVF
jgi:hypothetical protein